MPELPALRLLAPSSEVGDLFTRLVRDIFEVLGFDTEEPNVATAGREIDLAGRHREETHRLLCVECKATDKAIGGVGCFPGGASPYGCEEMAGNVFEWTRSLFESYPYDGRDGREELTNRASRVVRGGSFDYLIYDARCATRFALGPADRNSLIGFRVAVVRPFSSGL